MLIIHHPHFNYNKYFKWYKSLVEHFLTNPPESEYEMHHILPKSMGGNNDVSNFVKLPIRHHYVAHLLLWKCTIGSSHQKMAYAITCMRAGRDLVINSRLYEAAKQISMVYKKDLSRGMVAAVDSDGKSCYIKTTDPRYLSGELIAASKGRLLGRKQSVSHRANLSKSKLATLNPNHKWIISTPQGTFNSLGEAADAHNTSRTTILNRCNNKNFPDWSKISYTSPETHDELLN